MIASKDIPATTILKMMMTNPPLFNIAIPVLEPSDFNEAPDEYSSVMKYLHIYNTSYGSDGDMDKLDPASLKLFIQNDVTIQRSKAERITKVIDSIMTVDVCDMGVSLWNDTLAIYVKKARLHNILYEGVDYISGNNPDFSFEYLTTKVQDLAAISFDKKIGHDWKTDAEARWSEFCTERSRGIPSRIDLLNTIGFCRPGTLSLILGETNIGKCWDGDEQFTVFVSEELEEKMKEFGCFG